MTENDRLIQHLESLGRIEATPQSTRRAAERVRLALSAQLAPRSSFNRRMRMAAPVAAMVVVLAGVVVYLPSPVFNSANIAFAEVQQQVQKTRTVQYISTRFHKVPPDTRPGTGQAEIARIRIRGRYQKRIEDEDSMGNIDRVEVIDAKTGMWVSIDPLNKRFLILEQQTTVDLKDGVRTESAVGPNLDADFYESIRQIPDAEELPAQKVDGKTVVGFRETKTQGPVTWTQTVWADPQTKLPVRVDGSSRSTDPRIALADWVLSDFIFDAELDSELFSTEPPKGYSVERTSVTGIAPPK